MQYPDAVLIGNGINRINIDQSISWDGVLENLANDFSSELDLNNRFKPNPLGFEEIVHEKNATNNKGEEKNLKEKISDKIKKELHDKEGFNKFHSKVVNSQVKNVLTPNYDYSFELAKGIFTDSKKGSKERTHSIFRNHNDDDLHIWHMHGEINEPNSILIGFSQYFNYYRKIYDYFYGLEGSASIHNKVKNDYFMNDSWIESIFKNDLLIFGTGLDFHESHLWWLFKKRAELPRDLIKNRVRFCYPVFYENSSDDKCIIENMNRENKAKSDLLKSFSIEEYPTESNSYLEFYEKISKFFK